MRVKRDLKITMDGDLDLTEEIIGEDGEIMLDKQGEIAKDITSVEDLQFLIQSVYVRVKTQTPDWYVYPHIGANLEDFIGEPNNRATAQQIINNITYVLTFDNLIDSDDLTVEVVPANPDEIVVFIVVEVGVRGPITIPLQFSFTEGIIGGEQIL